MTLLIILFIDIVLHNSQGSLIKSKVLLLHCAAIGSVQRLVFNGFLFDMPEEVSFTGFCVIYWNLEST